ncbi:MAG: CRISPR-associated endoribonuclease Cas6 [bacterium]|nr:CRISPR-associated endoribonuclease Cas6 [bacterium]
MRLKVVFGEDGRKVRFDRDYRRYFISFIKRAFTISGVYDEIYSRKMSRPFTFSIFLGKQFTICEDHIEATTPMSLIFSTGDYSVFSNFYNGVVGMSNGSIKIGENEIQISRISLLRPVSISSDSVFFRTVGICVLTDPDANPDDFDSWFCVPEDSKFQEVVLKRTRQRYKHIYGHEFSGDISVEVKRSKTLYVEMGEEGEKFFIKGFKGVFRISSSPHVLQFIYDYGFGVRTGQGFGLVDVLDIQKPDEFSLYDT